MVTSCASSGASDKHSEGKRLLVPRLEPSVQLVGLVADGMKICLSSVFGTGPLIIIIILRSIIINGVS